MRTDSRRFAIMHPGCRLLVICAARSGNTGLLVERTEGVAGSGSPSARARQQSRPTAALTPRRPAPPRRSA
jgi:hypothetical protein